MRYMTTAEFGKANLAVIDEPVTVRRYKDIVGTFYPRGTEPSGGAKRISELEEEVRHLKRQLADRPAVAPPVVAVAAPTERYKTFTPTFNPVPKKK